jgi:hypothetical protein
MPKDTASPESTAAASRPAPPPNRGPRFVGVTGANIPPEIRRIFEKNGHKVAGGPQVAGAPVTVGTASPWGTDDAAIDAAYGTILSANVKRSSEKEKYPDNNGETIAYIYYDFLTSGSFECLLAGTLEPGDTISIGGSTLYVNDAEKQWEHKGLSKYRVNAEKHDGVSAGA